jgi:hypothetical protein
LLLELMYVMHFEVGIGEQPSSDSLEARVGNWEENTTEVNNITGVHLARQVAVHVYSHGSGYVSYWYLVGLQIVNGHTKAAGGRSPSLES